MGARYEAPGNADETALNGVAATCCTTNKHLNYYDLRGIYYSEKKIQIQTLFYRSECSKKQSSYLSDTRHKTTLRLA